jgi:hypothetical protein
VPTGRVRDRHRLHVLGGSDVRGSVLFHGVARAATLVHRVHKRPQCDPPACSLWQAPLGGEPALVLAQQGFRFDPITRNRGNRVT